MNWFWTLCLKPIDIVSPTVMEKKLQTDCHQNDDVLDYGHAGIRQVEPRMELIM